MTEITDLSATAPTPKKRARKSQPGISGLVNLALMVWMIWDIRHRTDEELNGKRKLTMAMVWRLHTGLGIPAESLIRQPG